MGIGGDKATSYPYKHGEKLLADADSILTHLHLHPKQPSDDPLSVEGLRAVNIQYDIEKGKISLVSTDSKVHNSFNSTITNEVTAIFKQAMTAYIQFKFLAKLEQKTQQTNDPELIKLLVVIKANLNNKSFPTTQINTVFDNVANYMKKQYQINISNIASLNDITRTLVDISKLLPAPPIAVEQNLTNRNR